MSKLDTILCRHTFFIVTGYKHKGKIDCEKTSTRLIYTTNNSLMYLFTIITCSVSVLSELVSSCWVCVCSKPKLRSMSALSHKLLDLYNTVKDSDDSHGRVMSTPFMKLPLKSVSVLSLHWICLHNKEYHSNMNYNIKHVTLQWNVCMCVMG